MTPPSTIFEAFKQLPKATRDDLVSYNLRGSVDGIAQSLAGEFKSLLPVSLVTKLTDKDKILIWLESLIPPPKRKPGDNWRSTFVKEFMQRWIKDPYPACGELAVKISSMCTSNKGSANNYYNQTLLIDVAPTSPFISEYNTHVKRAWTGIDKIGWRGDDRTPETIIGAQMDGTGFSPRKPISVPVWRTDEDKLDVDTDTTVCVAVDIRGCAFFPLSKPVQDTWIYCILLGEGWNTHYLQTKIATQKKLSSGSEEFNKKVWLFNERCVSQAKPQDIACAIKCHRTIRDGKDPLTGVRFQLGEVRKFPAYTRLTASIIIKIQNTVTKYAKMYPANPGKWLTYQGEVD